MALVWNQRKLQQPFAKGYEALLEKYAPEYKVVNHTNLSDEEIEGFFAPEDYQTFTFANSQVFDKAGFLGRMQSSSYVPSVETPEYTKVLASAEALFARYAESGKVAFDYDTRLFIGKLKPL